MEDSINVPIGTKFTTSDSLYLWTKTPTGFVLYKGDRFVYQAGLDEGLDDMNLWIKQGFTIELPKENLFDNLYKRMSNE